MMSIQGLRQLLLELDGRGYKSYKQIQGRYEYPGFTLLIDYVQGDPFAAPSRLRVQVPQSEAAFPRDVWRSPSREIALRDYLNRQFAKVAATLQERRGSGNSGLIAIAPTGQQVLDRTSILINAEQVEARFVVGLPARGRSVLGHQAADLLCDDLPQIVNRALKYANLDARAIQQHVETVEDADWLRSQLDAHNLTAFIPDGAVLPRQSGVQDTPLTASRALSLTKPAFDTTSPSDATSPSDTTSPMKEKGKPPAVVPFQTPDSLRVSFERPNQGYITGMGVPVGVTLIVGGGYHGKSTLLRAIALGIYNHIPGDGREQIVSHPGAVKVRAEDGRSIAGVDISPFINHLPQGRSTTNFSTENASGSTSQAANIVEALEAGATVLLVDEDTSATNFMIRDRRMQALVAKNKEPITPFVDKIRHLYQDHGVSTVLVMGGSGDYFDVANTVIAMSDYLPQDVTQQAKAIAAQYATNRTPEGGEQFGKLTPRVPLLQCLDSPPKIKVRDVDELVFGPEAVDLSAVEQIVEVGQLRAIGMAIAYLQTYYLDHKRTLAEVLGLVLRDIERATLDALTPYPQGDLVKFRALELAAVVNRLRSLEIGV